METLTGGRDFLAVKEDGTTETVSVQQIKLRDYTRAFAASEDEFALAAIACGKDRAWVESLTPETFENLQAVIQEINAKGFFAFARRQMDKVTARLNSVSPEVLRMATENASKPMPQGLQPR